MLNSAPPPPRNFILLETFLILVSHILSQVPEFLENLKTKKFVLIHGEGFGAWCWYKTVALLEEAGLHPVALDLTGSGIDLTDTNTVTTLAEYSKPLIAYLENLPEDEKVWLCDIRIILEFDL